ncbi:glycosyltransferase [Roseovarius aestuariivivens]|uniref:glycosyltransferase n=1 Tax=Roseovarius aestuariivivens TaxID=1888910 RepID=UPI00107FFDA2|nr:glycosyltransferase [Roseovarius aestuariivivens]
MTERGIPHVTILLAVHNGARYLPAQLQSFADQTHRNWHLIASVDGDEDNSRAVLQAFADKGHAVTVLDGPQQGAAANFLSLLMRMSRVVPGPSYLAFSDQDDVWMPDRLSAGLSVLADIDPEIPALFCARQMITDETLAPLRVSMARPRPPGFRNALVQNIASGNTSLLNPTGARLLCAAAEEAGPIVMHDWWSYQIVTGAGGRVLHHETPLIYYRQHDHNAMGANTSPKAQASRLSMMVRGTYRHWMDLNVAALSRSAHRFTPRNRALLRRFKAMRHAPLPLRLWRFSRLRLYRQRRVGTAVLWLSVLLGRL